MMNFDLKANALGLVLKTIGIEPTADGLMRAFHIEPATVYSVAETIQRDAPGFIAWAQKEAPDLLKKIEGFDARMTRIEHMLGLLVSQHDHNARVRPAGQVHQLAPKLAQEVAEAAIAEASGRS